MKKNREYKKLTKGKFLALGGLLFTLGIITSVTSTYAWYTIREQFTVDNLNISIDMADKAYLKLYLNPDKENIVDTSKSVDELINNRQLLYSETGYTKEELGIKDPLTDVSGMFESDWLNSGTNMKSALPKLHSNYQGKFGNYKNPGYCTDKDVYVQNVFYLESGFDCSVYLDPSSFVRANVEENEKSARIHSREVEELNDVVHTVRVSFFTDEGYIIANPGESNVTYYGGILDLNQDGYYDYNLNNEIQEEILYGEYPDNVTLPYQTPLSESEPYPEELCTTFVSNHNKETKWLDNSDNTYENLGIKKELSLKFDELRYEEDDPFKKTTPITHLKGGELKRIVVSIYIEGWDKHMTNAIEDACFDISLAFLALFDL